MQLNYLILNKINHHSQQLRQTLVTICLIISLELNMAFLYIYKYGIYLFYLFSTSIAISLLCMIPKSSLLFPVDFHFIFLLFTYVTFSLIIVAFSLC